MMQLTMLFITIFCSMLLPFTAFFADGSTRVICEFPSDLQTNLTGRKWSRDWQSRIKEQFTEFTLKIEVTRNIMRMISTDATANSNSRVCLRQVDGNKYLVMHEESGQIRQKYLCLQFLFRSPDVFQIRSSPLSDSMEISSLCSDDILQLDKWLIVDKARIGRERLGPCALKGGFNILVYDKSRQSGVCDAWRGEIRMESECSYGDGLTFYFRSQRCVPEDMYMYATQPTICLANWNEGIYTFSLIRHNIFNYMWLLRFPTIRQNVFTTYLLKDLFADTADIITETYRYLRFDTIQDDPYNLTTLCRDDYEICTSVQAPCASTLSHLAITCPLTCGICNSVRPVLCNINPDWIGSWSDRATHGNFTRDVYVNSTTVTVSSKVKGKENYRCIQWTSSSGATVNTSTDNMFVTEYSNGCRPRYTCARVLKQSSSLLYLELSKHMMWPLIRARNDTVSCERFSFTSHDQHLLLHTAHRSEEPVHCSLPTEAFNTFKIRLQNGTECQGSLTETSEGTGFNMNMIDCQLDLLLERSFLCLESSLTESTSHRLVITKLTQNESDSLYCWLFPKHQPSILYLLDAVHCHLALKPNVRLVPSQYILQGLPANKIYISTVASGKVRSFSSRGQSNETLVSENNESVIQTTKRTAAVSIQPTTVQEDAFTPSPVAVVFVVVIFAILQAVFLCKC